MTPRAHLWALLGMLGVPLIVDFVAFTILVAAVIAIEVLVVVVVVVVVAVVVAAVVVVVVVVVQLPDLKTWIPGLRDIPCFSSCPASSSIFFLLIACLDLIGVRPGGHEALLNRPLALLRVQRGGAQMFARSLT